jgi:hypothetical protein
MGHSSLDGVRFTGLKQFGSHFFGLSGATGSVIIHRCAADSDTGAVLPRNNKYYDNARYANVVSDKSIYSH